MTFPADMHRGLALRSYLAATHLVPLVAKPLLKRRLARAKEHPVRWQEKLGFGLAPRPEGPLIWLHAVGLGEVLSLRGLIARLAGLRPDLSFLVTSSTVTSAGAFAKNAPPRTVHQFLPLDAPPYRKRFLDHFAPDLCIWAEQDLWPGLVSDLAARRIPQCMVAARMNAKSFAGHQKAASLYRDLYRAMAQITAQDEATAAHLSQLDASVKVTGSLKPAAPHLSCDENALTKLRTAFGGRTVWTVAPAHPDDITRACAAHDLLRKVDPTALLIIAPRFPNNTLALDAPRKSKEQVPGSDDPIWLCDTFGDLGLVYRLAQAALIGGTFSDIEGHSPWEAAALGCAILHGPRIANFAADYAQLASAGGSLQVETPQSVAQAVAAETLPTLAKNAADAKEAAAKQTDDLAADLIALFEASYGR